MFGFGKTPPPENLLPKLRGFDKKINQEKNIKEKRKLVSIALIDDEPFAAKQSLTNLGYSLTELGDINRIDEIEKFPIVLCDLKGVGKNFNYKTEGAGLIGEIKANYPNIYVLAYTGNLRGGLASSAREVADGFLRKDATNEQWVLLLDEYVDKTTSVQQVWLNARRNLCDLGVETHVVLALEKAYCEDVLSKDADFSMLRKTQSDTAIGATAKNIVTGIVSNGIFAALAALI